MLTQGFNLVGNHPKFNSALEMARNVAVTKTPILISGETGSGKKAITTVVGQGAILG
jgi:DNA-binding NtrC family response regulator